MHLIFSRLFYILLIITVSACSSLDTKEQAEVWIDVRRVAEFEESHIENTLNMPHTSISETITSAVPDKNTKIYLYCRSGRRAGLAEQTLEKLGYTNIINLGGIADARKARRE